MGDWYTNFSIVWAITAMLTYIASEYIRPIRKYATILQIEIVCWRYVHTCRRISEGKVGREALYNNPRLWRIKIGSLADMQKTFHLCGQHCMALFSMRIWGIQGHLSDRVHTIMKLLTRSVHRSHEQRVCDIKIADHLKELQDVETNIRSRYMNVTSTMGSTAHYLLPLSQAWSLLFRRWPEDLLNISKDPGISGWI